MFSGIIENIARIIEISQEGSNKRFTLYSLLTPELQVKQSIAHNGVCLTIDQIDSDNNTYSVVAVAETLHRTNLGLMLAGDHVNIERCLSLNTLIDGHLVLGHVDCVGTITAIVPQNGSWKLYVSFPAEYQSLIVSKGSITINGVSLTVVDAFSDWLSVVIVPYTYSHTTFSLLKSGYKVNLEFDIIAKFIQKQLFAYASVNSKINLDL